MQEPAPAAQPDRGRGETPAFRPISRPPMGLLHVLDDGETAGEVVRVRDGSFVIGRVEGNLVIPHDTGMSGRHAEIVRRGDGGAWSWHLRDLGSTNGTFVRASTVMLYQDQEFMVGVRLFRFQAAAPLAGAEEPSPKAITTRKWEVPTRTGAGAGSGSGGPVPGAAPAALVEISKGAEVRRHALTEGEYWLGRDATTCAVVVDDPYVDPRHARIYRDEKGRWVLVNERSRNGLWARVSEVGLDRGGFFQCGEQRFLFKAL
jgi:pSer/pThr/pTyr-binding forkhead associated (FHA) protein